MWDDGRTATSDIIWHELSRDSPVFATVTFDPSEIVADPTVSKSPNFREIRDSDNELLRFNAQIRLNLVHFSWKNVDFSPIMEAIR